ncbi:MAG: DNA polymerase III subunit delta [bacterium]
MVILIYGEDGYRADAKLHQLAEHFHAKFDKGGMNKDSFDASEVVLVKARDVIVAPPFLAEKRFVIVRRFSSWTEDEAFAAMLKAIPASTVAVFVDEISEKDFAALKLKKNEKDWFEYPFPSLVPGALATFAVEEAKRLGATLAPAVANALISRVALDTWSVATEVAKLAAMSSNGIITREHVAEHLPERADDKIFDLVDAIAGGSSKTALTLLENQLQFGSHPFQLLTMIERQVRLLLSARSAYESGITTPDALASTLAVHPFVARKLLASVQRPNPRLSSLLIKIAELDSRMKTGQVEANVGITMLLAV